MEEHMYVGCRQGLCPCSMTSCETHVLGPQAFIFLKMTRKIMHTSQRIRFIPINSGFNYPNVLLRLPANIPCISWDSILTLVYFPEKAWFDLHPWSSRGWWVGKNFQNTEERINKPVRRKEYKLLKVLTVLFVIEK